MQGNPAVIASLQANLAAEAHLNLQYRMDQSSLKFMGLTSVGHKMKKFGDHAHHFYRSLTKQILFLGGKPSYQIAAVTEQQTLTGLLENALAMEMNMVKMGRDAIAIAVRASDEATAEKMRHIEERHELHVGWLEQRLALIANLGEKEFIAEMI